MKNRSRYILSYDISNDTRRTRIAQFLLGYGNRVQKSVFEANLNPRELKEILSQAAKQIEPTDSFRAYLTCGRCCAGVQTLGRDIPALDGDLYIV